MIKFPESDENRTIPVSQLEKEIVDTSVIKMVELIRKDLAELLVTEVDKGAALSVEYLLQNFSNIINCGSSYVLTMVGLPIALRSALTVRKEIS